MTDSAQLRAYSMVKVLPQGEAFFLSESPAEVRAKLAEAREATSMGLGTDDLEEKSGLLVFMGIDVYTPEAGEVEPIIEPTEISLHPGTIGLIRGVSDRFWEGHLFNARGQEPPPQRGGASGLEEALHAAGFQFQTVDLGEALRGFEAQPPREEPSRHGAEPALVGDTAAETECCCGHQARGHAINGEFYGECTQCKCPVFHTHAEDAQEKT